MTLGRFGDPSWQWQQLSGNELPPAIVTRAYIAGSQVVLNRAYIGRFPPAPHVARPLPIPQQPLVIQIIVSRQSIQRALTGRSIFPAHVAPPVIVRTPPFKPAIVKSEAIARAYIGRFPPKPHLAPPNLAPPPFPPARIISQHLRRPYVGRTIPRPHVAPPNLAPKPFPPAKIISQAIQRPLSRRTVPPPHLPPRTLTPPPFPPTRFIRAIPRPTYLPIRPHLAPPIVTPIATGPPVPRGTFVFVRNRFPIPPRPHVAPPNLAPPPIVVQCIVGFQARQRALTRRHPPLPHLAPPNLTAPTLPPVARGTFVYTAISRARTGRTIFRPHLAPPVPEVVDALVLQIIVSQALERSLTRRAVLPRPHLAPPIVGPHVTTTPNRWLMTRRRGMSGAGRPIRYRWPKP